MVFADRCAGSIAKAKQPGAPVSNLISITYETFSIDLASAARLLRADRSDADLYDLLVKLVGEKKATQEEFKYEHAQENIVRPLPIILSVEEQRRKEEEERLRKEEEERKLKEKYDGMDPLVRRRLAKSITFNGIYEGLDMGDR